MSKFFKPEDFITIHFNNVGREIHSLGDENHVAEKANAKLEREGKVVYRPKNDTIWYELNRNKYDEKALLIAIESIAPCTHPSEKVKEVPAYLPNDFRFRCECGARVTPPVGNWVEVEVKG